MKFQFLKPRPLSAGFHLHNKFLKKLPIFLDKLLITCDLKRIYISFETHFYIYDKNFFKIITFRACKSICSEIRY